MVSFEEQVSVIREELANVYEKEEDWAKAAKMLAGIPLDSGIRVLDDNYKVEKYIKIAQLYLEDEEPVSAETFINRASLLINEETEPSLRLLHKARRGQWAGRARRGWAGRREARGGPSGQRRVGGVGGRELTCGRRPVHTGVLCAHP